MGDRLFLYSDNRKKKRGAGWFVKYITERSEFMAFEIKDGLLLNYIPEENETTSVIPEGVTDVVGALIVKIAEN